MATVDRLPDRQDTAVISVPSGDLAFSAAARRVAHDLDVVTSVGLEAGMRLVYPRTIVRSRELSGERQLTLYAYRDGSFLPDPDAGWADADGVAWAAFDPHSGEILEANTALERLFRVDGPLRGRHAREFAPDGADRISDEQLQAIASAGGARSRGLGRRGDGSEVLVDFVARVVGDRIEAWYRAAENDA